MKKVFLYMSVLAAAMSCETMYGPVQTPLAADKADDIEINVQSTGDNAVSFELAPKGEVSYYSYLVDAADAPEELDPSALFACQYDGVAKGTVKWTDEKKSAVISLEKLAPNTTYQIYAVAGSPMGFPGSVKTVSFKTSDKVAPEFVKFETDNNQVVLVFSENIVSGDAGSISAKYYAFNDEGFLEGTPVGTVTADMTKVVVKGNMAGVSFEGLPAGAFYAVSYTEGTFKDLAGNPVEALESSMYLDGDSYETVDDGICGRMNTKPFSLGEFAEEKITDWESPIVIDFGSEYGYGYMYKDVESSVSFSHNGKTTVLTLTPGSDFGVVNDGKVMIIVPELPERGDNVVFKIGAETFEDYYGNMNEEWETEVFYPYSYTLENVIGNYAAQYISALDGQRYQMGLSIAAVTEEDEASEDFIDGCNVKFTAFESTAARSPIYACFEAEMGTLTIPSLQVYNMLKNGDQTLLLAFITVTDYNPDTETPTVLKMTEDGVLTEQSSMFGSLLIDAASGKPFNWYDVYTSFYALKTTAEEAVSTMSLARDFKFYPLDTEFVVK